MTELENVMLCKSYQPEYKKKYNSVYTNFYESNTTIKGKIKYQSLLAGKVCTLQPPKNNIITFD